jgi:hypothetical protein
VRRYFWQAALTEPDLAYEALAPIKQLFAVARAAKALPMPERTAYRAERARPILEVFDRWVDRNRNRVDPRGKLDAAFTYYSNQRDSLRRFLDDGRLSIDNNHSERELRNLVGGRDNWKHFENETGLRWYTTFRSLIASCEVERLNPHEYLEPLLRLLPHWPQTRVLELAPKYWRDTVSKLDARQRAIIHPPWIRPTSPPRADDGPLIAV